MLGNGDRAAELFAILNPIRRTSTRTDVHRYKVEPYVACADVYAQPPHVGRGGWTWYTGSAAWMYRVVLEGLLGLKMEGEILLLNPCIPRGWPGFEITFRHGKTIYEIVVENRNGAGRGITRVTLDGVDMESKTVRLALKYDGATHHLRVVLG
jgi:cyclic beta-1,2-glucan synthetase